MKLRGFTLTALAATLRGITGTAFAALVDGSEASPEGFNPHDSSTGTTADASAVPM